MVERGLTHFFRHTRDIAYGLSILYNLVYTKTNVMNIKLLDATIMHFYKNPDRQILLDEIKTDAINMKKPNWVKALIYHLVKDGYVYRNDTTRRDSTTAETYSIS